MSNKSRTQYDTHVYLGPTLKLENAKEILPHAHYHPPVQCGDVARLMRLNPKKIIIIDGFYESVPSVWHKEILLALNYGVEVWGGASMGALRAAELNKLGMKGVGKVYDMFASGELEDDDEVAVIHHGKAKLFEAINDAMVDIRVTVKNCMVAKVINADLAEQIIKHCKQQFYPKRSLVKASQNLLNAFSAFDGKDMEDNDQSGPNKKFDNKCNNIFESLLVINSESGVKNLSRQNKREDIMRQLENFIDWLGVNGLVEQKKKDAIGLLRAVSKSNGLDIYSDEGVPGGIKHTKYLRSIVNYANSTPFVCDYDWLPRSEKSYRKIFFGSWPVKEFVNDLITKMSVIYRFAYKDIRNIQDESLYWMIQENGLFNPKNILSIMPDGNITDMIKKYILEQICLLNLTPELIENQVGLFASYYELNDWMVRDEMKPLLYVHWLIVIILIAKFKVDDMQISRDYLKARMYKLAERREYGQEKMTAWLQGPNNDVNDFSVMLIRLNKLYWRHIDNDLGVDILAGKNHGVFDWVSIAMGCYSNCCASQGLTTATEADA